MEARPEETGLPEERQENKMGVMPVRRLLTTMSVPLMVSMLLQAMYNIVDSIFVARVSDQAFAALSYAFPIQTLMIAVAVGTGIGLNTLLSRRLGQHRYEEANRVAVNGIFVYLMSWIVFAVLGLLFARPFFELCSPDPEVVEAGTVFLTICSVFSLGMFLQFAAERLMQATGNTVYQMMIQGLGAAINIALDPLFIYGLFGLPAMGVAGAAVATVTGQTIAMVMGMALNIRKNKEVTLRLRGFRPDWGIIREIYRVGLPSIVIQSMVSLMTLSLNLILTAYSGTLVLVLGIYFKLQSFVFMPIFGITGSLIPIVGFNYGARRPKRILETVRFALKLSAAIMLGGMLLIQLFPVPLLRLFNASPATMAAGISALRIISSSFLFCGVFFVLTAALQALGRGVLSMAMSIVRQMGLLVPAAWLIARFVSPYLTWAAFPLAETVTAAASALVFRRVYREWVAVLEQPAEERVRFGGEKPAAADGK